MPKKSLGVDQLFTQAEDLASDFSLFPQAENLTLDHYVRGLLNPDKIAVTIKQLRKAKVDDYIARTVTPAEDKSRPNAKTILMRLDGEMIREIENGPLYAVEMYLDFGDGKRRIGFLAQNRAVSNGVWMPEHHMLAISVIREFAEYSIPIVTLMDTPGADAGEMANRNNQAHAISRLITEMALLDIPTIGIILGNGYSGGAIPLATTNLILSVRDGVFNTIQPRGLASIARKYNLSWQECAKYVGVSSYELYKQGYVDGIIDFVPMDADDKLENLRQAITSGIQSIEESVKFFVLQNPYVFEHYNRSIFRYLTPSDDLDQYQRISLLKLPKNPTCQLNVFGSTYRYQRYLSLRKRIRSTTIERYGRLSVQEIPKGDLHERTEREQQEAFRQWLDNPLEIKYDNALNKSWKNYLYFRQKLYNQRGKIKKFILGDPRENYQNSLRELTLCFALHLYNLWKDSAQNNFYALNDLLLELDGKKIESVQQLTVLDVISNAEIKLFILDECRNFILFDLVYDNIVKNLIAIAREAHEHNALTNEFVKKLMEESVAQAVNEIIKKLPANLLPKNPATTFKEQFLDWLYQFISQPQCSSLLKSISEWKKMVYPRISETLFAVINYYFEHFILQFYESEFSGKPFDGRINPRNIGMKDFWNRLNIAYTDLLIQDILLKFKKSQRISADTLSDRFFTEFIEMNGNYMTCDPFNFPGFRISIEEALAKNIKPCGIITGTARLKIKNNRRKVGVVISNLDFQAGAFDMASSEKFCKLLVKCAHKHYPIICFISSGGMQTKEGAGALFSMAIINDRISRFVRDNDLSMICFGFGDCTGGAQASFVTHPLVQTYYFSGTNMPFAGQIVVPSYLPVQSTLSNYLVKVPGAMRGLVKHPFFEDLDQSLKTIDANIPVATETVEEVIERILHGELIVEENEDLEGTKTVSSLSLCKPVKRMLLHARGCTAVKIIRIAHKHDIQVILVQSDPDMESVAAGMLNQNDRLICLGGNTSDESYLNAHSVVRIAEREKCDSLHPGIGFLSENPQFADLCLNHHLNFIGPPVISMELMGNKSNAINTALELKIPVVPGSHGIVTSSEAALAIANKIGYPIVIKAVHGGGGKGIRIVDSDHNFHEIFVQMMAEAKSAFGNSDVYIEKCITSLRHIEVQILRDSFGNTQILGLRDCTVQRKNQKIVEESGSTMLSEELKKDAFNYAKAIADKISYMGAGTIEFIFDLKSNAIYFMEMNTRLQVEHPVTEQVTGIDIVGTQFKIASGETIADMTFKEKGFAIEVRVNAEKPMLNDANEVEFIPDPGEITEFALPEENHIQLIAAMAKDKVVPPYYDSMIAQIICTGKNRTDTIEKLRTYLGRIKIKGISTNIPLLIHILNDAVFIKGDYDTGYLPKLLSRIDTNALIAESEKFAGQAKQSLHIDAIKIEDSDELKVLAPSTGVFYITPSPTEPSFVSEGDVIGIEKTICLLEAMKVFRSISLKLFNRDEIPVYPPSHGYKIIRINRVNGQTVNRGDLLFVIKPVVKKI